MYPAKWSSVALIWCIYGAMADAPRPIAPGTWGGLHAVLEVSDKGAEIEFDCAHGRVDGPLAVDAHGAFDLPGTFTPEHGGPVRRDEQPPKLEARYTGRVEGKAMTLTVFREGKEIGSFTLTQGSPGRLWKCR